ncbi:MAG: hypothetical protein ACI89L_001867 [Phycisphaerales bacterium]|jgi:hypothetical protein
MEEFAGILPVNTSWVAIVAGYLGLFTITLVAAPFALLAGILALFHLNKHPDLRGRVRAWFAIIMSLIAIPFFVLLMMT